MAGAVRWREKGRRTPVREPSVPSKEFSLGGAQANLKGFRAISLTFLQLHKNAFPESPDGADSLFPKETNSCGRGDGCDKAFSH